MSGLTFHQIEIKSPLRFLSMRIRVLLFRSIKMTVYSFPCIPVSSVWSHLLHPDMLFPDALVVKLRDQPIWISFLLPLRMVTGQGWDGEFSGTCRYSPNPLSRTLFSAHLTHSARCALVYPRFFCASWLEGTCVLPLGQPSLEATGFRPAKLATSGSRIEPWYLNEKSYLTGQGLPLISA